MKTLAKYRVCNHYVIGEITFQNILIGPGKLPGRLRNGRQVCKRIPENYIFCYEIAPGFRELSHTSPSKDPRSALREGGGVNGYILAQKVHS